MLFRSDRAAGVDGAPKQPAARGVLVYGYFGIGNFGDDLLALATIDGLRTRGFSGPFVLRAYGPVPTLALVDLDVELACHEHLLAQGGGALAKTFALAGYLRAYWGVLARCDYLVYGGGTLLGGQQSVGSLLVQAGVVALARIRRVKMAALGLGLTPVDSWLKRLLVSSVLGSFVAVWLRDPESAEIARALRTRARCVVGDDLVYGMAGWFDADPFASRPTRSRGAGLRIGISLAAPHLVSLESSRRSKFLAELRKAVETWVEQGYEVMLISFQEPPDGSSAFGDSPLLATLARPTPNGPVRAVTLRADRVQVRGVFSGIDVLVGMRFHGMVMASLGGVPFVGLAHDPKVLAICGAFGMPHVGLDDVTADWIYSAVDRALATPMKLGRIAAKRDSAGIAFDAVVRDLRAA